MCGITSDSSVCVLNIRRFASKVIGPIKPMIMLIHLIALVSLVITTVKGQESPCPDVFKYEPRNYSQPDRWYGVITIGTDEDLEGVWIKITLDRRADLLGNWFSEAISKDNLVFSIRNPQYKLAAGPPILIRFFVKFNPSDDPPMVSRILLNGKTICPNNKYSPTEQTLHLSVGNRNSEEWDENSYKPSHTSSSNSETRTSTRRPTSTSTRESTHKRPLNTILFSSNENDDFYQGDFHIVTSHRTGSRPLATSSDSIQCGTVAQRPSPLISHGEETSPGQWPWHAALYIYKGPELKYTCGGTLISKKHVVTAAHCVTKPRTTTPVQKDKLVVYLGKYNMISFGGEVQDRQIESIIIHSEYNSSVYFNDIALLKLDSSLEINNFVRPCCLWGETDNNIENIIGKSGTVVGWGFNEEGQLSRNLMQAQLPVVSTTTCLFSNRNFFSQFIYDKNFCAGYRNDTSVCNGDSGGGMVLPKSGTRGQNTVWQLRGIISLGVARQSVAVCDPKQYSILTDAAKFVGWLKQHMRED